MEKSCAKTRFPRLVSKAAFADSGDLGLEDETPLVVFPSPSNGFSKSEMHPGQFARTISGFPEKAGSVFLGFLKFSFSGWTRPQQNRFARASMLARPR